MKGWGVNYDFLSHSNKVVKSLNRTRLGVVQKGKEEVFYDRPPQQQKIIDGNLDVDYKDNDNVEEDTESNTNVNNSKKKETALTKSIQLLCEQSDNTLASATSFTYEYISNRNS
eukprot:6811511-Ditylum_brightwellii.AAC.1